jgi:hypothetical protein
MRPDLGPEAVPFREFCRATGRPRLSAYHELGHRLELIARAYREAASSAGGDLAA